MTRRFLLATLAAGMVLAATVLGRYTDEAMPPAYLLRPLLVAVGLAVLIGAVAQPARSWAVPVAAGLAFVLALADPGITLALVAVLIVLELLRRRGRMPRDLQSPVLVLATIYFALGLVRALAVTQWPDEVGYQPDSSGPPMYVFLLDGYPRIDTLRNLGFDNEPFVDALADRGFDHYPDSHSEHTRTHKTLLGALTEMSVNDDPVTVAVRRQIRRLLVVPPGFVEIDPPIGFVTMGSGPHVPVGGPTDFEAQLIGQSIVGVLVPDWAWDALLAGLDDNIDAEFEEAATTDAHRVFTHVMAPHPPFLYPWGGATSVPRRCWPGCGIFVHTYEDMGLTHEEWAAGMSAQVEAVNAKLLDTIDRILARHPDAVIVLFSDHGGRADREDEAELHRSFLAARTPDHPKLYAANPEAEEVIRVLLGAYGSN